MTRRDLMAKAAALASVALIPFRPKPKPRLRPTELSITVRVSDAGCKPGELWVNLGRCWRKISVPSPFWPPFTTYGGPSSLWGDTMTVGDANSADFGVTRAT